MLSSLRESRQSIVDTVRTAFTTPVMAALVKKKKQLWGEPAKVDAFKAFIELFCLQNSLIVGMQPQVSGKAGSLVGWLVGWTMFGIPDDC